MVIFSVATLLDPRYMITNIEQKDKFTDIFLFVFLDLRACITLMLHGWRVKPSFFSLGRLMRKRYAKENPLAALIHCGVNTM
jgi:hypothetical protein